ELEDRLQMVNARMQLLVVQVQTGKLTEQMYTELLKKKVMPFDEVILISFADRRRKAKSKGILGQRQQRSCKTCINKIQVDVKRVTGGYWWRLVLFLLLIFQIIRTTSS